MFFLPSVPIDFNSVSSKWRSFKIFLLKDLAFPDSNKKPVFSSIIVSLEPPILLAITGFLFESGNAKSLSQKILKLLYFDEIQLESIGNEGRKNIVKKFNVEKMCFSTYSEYKRLLD